MFEHSDPLFGGLTPPPPDTTGESYASVAAAGTPPSQISEELQALWVPADAEPPRQTDSEAGSPPQDGEEPHELVAAADERAEVPSDEPSVPSGWTSPPLLPRRPQSPRPKVGNVAALFAAAPWHAPGKLSHRVGRTAAWIGNRMLKQYVAFLGSPTEPALIKAAPPAIAAAHIYTGPTYSNVALQVIDRTLELGTHSNLSAGALALSGLYTLIAMRLYDPNEPRQPLRRRVGLAVIDAFKHSGRRR